MSVRHSPSTRRQPINYSPYGYHNAEIQITGSLGFNGELIFTLEACYALGNGHRIYNSRLMRFISADAQSPFQRGGINCYAYCLDDPVNTKDPSGRLSFKTAAIVARAVNRFKRPLNTPKKAWPTLENTEALNLMNEMAEAEELLNTGKAYLTWAKDPTSLLELPEAGFKNKFVLTRNNNLFIGSYSEGDLSHAAIARFGQLATGASDVVSAGYINRDGIVLSINEHSGHYRTPTEHLKPTYDYLASLRMTVRR